MQNKNQKVVCKKNTLCPLALEGEGGTKYRVRGKDPKATLICTPSSVLRTSSPSWGRGFTLLELLVVVLIIGILSAVAVPQYQKAVEKSKATQAWPILKAFYQAAVSYHLANDNYPTEISQLDLDLPWTGTTKWYSFAEDEATRSNEEWSLTIDDTKVSIGRMNGPYAGGGFAIYFNNGELICVERTQYGIILEEEGKYCQKLFGGIDLNASDIHRSLRQYSMP